MASPFTFQQRLLLTLIEFIGSALLWLVGRTLRYSVVVEEGGPPGGYMAPAVYGFWHRCVLAATFYYRRRHIAVVTSKSLDGEYIARIIERFGFRAVRGSSSRGGARALLECHREIEQGRSVAFTIDGPRGPRYVAKPGAALLARNSGAPLIPFYVAARNPWVLNSWDRFVIPKPFSRAVMVMGRMMHVAPNADETELARIHAEYQAALERVRDTAESAAGNPPVEK